MHDLRKIIPILVSLGLMVLIIPSYVIAVEAYQGSMEKKTDRTADGGYHIQLGEMNVFYFGYRMQFNTADTEDFDDFQLNMRILKVQGDLEGNGSGDYFCNLDQAIWQYHTGEGYGLLEGFADLSLEKVGSHGQNTDVSSSTVDSGQHYDPMNSGNQGGSKIDDTGGRPDDGGNEPGSNEKILNDWGRLMIRFQGLNDEGGLKFDIRIQLKEAARGDTKIRLEQYMDGQENTYEHKHVTRSGGTVVSGNKRGEYQLRTDDKVVAKYSWLYQYNATNENGTHIEDRSMNEDISEGGIIAFEYQVKEGEQNILHDPNIFVNRENIISILNDAKDLVEEHWISILTGVFIGMVLMMIVFTFFIKLSGKGSNDDEKFDLKKNRYYR